MNPANGSGVDYPTITLAGITYVAKFTRGAFLYRLNKSGSGFDLRGPKGFSVLIDMLHAAINPPMPPDELAEILLAEDKAAEAGQVIGEALKKVFPPSMATDLAERTKATSLTQ